MQGTLTKTCLPDLLRTIYTERRSGELIVNQGNIKKQIYFELGQIVFAASNRKEDRLGEALVRHGKLTREQLDQFLGTLTRGRHLGKALVERGVLTDRELITYVNFQLIDIIYSLFTWTLGNFEFAESENNRAPEELKLRFSTATIILEGIRRIEDFDIIRRGLSDLNRLIAPTSSPLLRLQSITLRPLERFVLDMVNQPIDLLRVIISTTEPPQKTLQALYGLLSIGLLQQVANAEISAKTGLLVVPEPVRQQAEAAPPAEYTGRSTGALRLEDATLQNELAEMKERITTQDARTILGLTPQSNSGEIRDAYYRLATKFHPDRFIQSSRQVREDIDLIFAKLTESYNRLRSGMTAANLRPNIPGTIAPVATEPVAGIAPPPPGYTSSNYAANSATSTSVRQTGALKPVGSTSPSADRGITRAVSDELSYPGYTMNKTPQRGGKGKVDIEAALNDLLDFLDDRKAPLFVAESLTTLFRTKPPIYVEQTRVVEAIVSWSRQKAGLTGRPLHEMLVQVINSIRHAEQARVLQDFDPNIFYSRFIEEMAGYCPPSERHDFLTKVGTA